MRHGVAPGSEFKTVAQGEVRIPRVVEASVETRNLDVLPGFSDLRVVHEQHRVPSVGEVGCHGGLEAVEDGLEQRRLGRVVVRRVDERVREASAAVIDGRQRSHVRARAARVVASVHHIGVTRRVVVRRVGGRAMAARSDS